MKELDYFVMSLLVSLVLACALFSGCSHTRRTLELQCISPSVRYAVEGPVIFKDDAVIYYDSKGNLKKQTGTCGVRGN